MNFRYKYRVRIKNNLIFVNSFVLINTSIIQLYKVCIDGNKYLLYFAYVDGY